MDRMRLPIDQGRLKLRAKRVFEYRRWETNDEGQRAQSQTQATTKKGVPLWEVVCVTMGEGPEVLRVVVKGGVKPELDQGSEVMFDGLDAVIWKGKNGIGADYYANEVMKSENQEIQQAA